MTAPRRTPWAHLARRAAGPVAVAAARLRARPGRTALVVAGIAAATAMLVGVLGGGLVARDRAVRSSIATLPASDRSFRVDSFGLPPGRSYRAADREVRRVLATLTPREPLVGSFFRQLQIGGGPVLLGSLDHLAGLVRLRSGRLPRECLPARCEVLQVGVGARRFWRQDDIDLVRVGVATVHDAALFGAWLVPSAGTGGGRPTHLLTAGANTFDRIPALEGFYRAYSWIAPIAPGTIHIWEIEGILARESRAHTALARSGAEYELSGPDSALAAVRTTSHVAGQRLSLIGGEISALLVGFALVAAVGLRRGLAAERRRLVQRGAAAWQVHVAVGAEIAATTVAGGVMGVIGGVAALAIVARRAGLPWGAVLTHGPGSAAGVAFVLLLWVAATAALLLVSGGGSDPAAGPRVSGNRVRVVDVLGIAAAGAAAIGLDRGALDAGTLASGNEATFLLLLPGLVCVAAAVVVARLLGPLMRVAERLTRRAALAPRLAMLALARAPARTAATTSFLVVAVGLALFATAYRATLERGAGDEAAFAVPLDFTLTEGTKLVVPLEAAPLERFDGIAPGVRAYPVVRQTADVPGAGTSALNPTVLGLPPGALARLRWRRDFARVPLSTLASRVGADPPASLRGLSLPPGSTISLRAGIRGAPVQLALAAETETGDALVLWLRERAGGRFTVRTPETGPLELVGLEVEVAAAEAVGLAHRAGEGVQPRIPQGSVALGPLRAGGRTLTTWRGWVAPGGAVRNAGGRVQLSYAFTTGQTVLLRRPQATDGRPLRVIASPEIARAAGPGGAIVLDFGVGRIPARIVGVAARFPDSGRQGDGFVVADESRLAVALDGNLPGTGRPTELWLSAPSAERRRVENVLGRPPFSSLDVASRSALEHELAADPLARGVTLTLEAAALVAVALAVLALWLALAGEVGDERGELLDLEAQGVAPETLRRQFRVRAAVLVAIALAGGAALGLLLSRIAVGVVLLSAGGTTPEPPLRVEPAWTLELIGLAAIAAAAWAAVELTTRHAFRGDTPARPSWSLE